MSESGSRSEGEEIDLGDRPPLPARRARAEARQARSKKPPRPTA
ncbi:MAG: hypothetical protein ACYTGZ_06185 [Planctomycetota bacterium]